MLVKFLNSGDRVSTTIAGSYFKGDGWTGAYYDSVGGRLVFESEDGLGFTTGDLRVATGGASSVEWTTVLNKPTEFTPVSHNHTISQVTDLQSVIDAKADKSQILTQQQLKDFVAGMFQSGTHTNVSISYDSVAGTINLSAVGAGTADLDLTNVRRVVVIGASIMNMLAGNNLATRHWESTNALNMPGIDVFGGSTSGEAMAAQIDNVAAALAAFPVVGETVFLLHTGGNDITPRVPFSGASAADLDLMRARLNAVLDAFGAHLPYVAAMPPSFRSYTAQGFGPRELYNDQMEGSLGFNEAVFKPIYAARINPRWRYADGESVMCFYDQVRNDFETWLSDGIHITWTSERRSAVLGRLAAAILGNRPVRVVPDPVDTTAPVFTIPASIAPVSGPVGTVFTLNNGTITGDAPSTVSGILTLDGVDVTSEIAAGQYTSTASGDLVWTVTASNAVASGITSSATATVSAVVSNLVAYVSYADTPSGATGLNELPNAYANAVTDTSGPVANLVDRAGASLGWTYQARSPSSSATAGVGINPGTIAGDATVLAFDGSTILADEVIAASLYAPAAQNVIHAVGSLIPGRSYEFRFVGSRIGSAGRTSRFTEPGGTYVEVNPNLQPSTSNAPSAPLTAVANGGGFVLITQSASAGTFSYLGGFSIRQVPV